MKKTMAIIVIFAVLLGLGSAASGSAADGKVGSKAPMFKIERSDSTVALDDMKGKWVLLQFWASSDADSRIACKQYTMLEQNQESSNSGERFHLLAINLDRSERLFREIVRRDGLSAESQFFIERSNAEKFIDDYHLESGLSSFLIDPNGLIVAKNPSEQQLIELAIN